MQKNNNCCLGTSWHAGLVGEYLIESIAKIPVEVEYASEFRYRDPLVFQDDIVIPISQSGETADTLAAIKLPKKKIHSFMEFVMLLEVVFLDRPIQESILTQDLK